MDQLRLLNVDDFMILRGLHEGLSVTSVGHKLGLSQPAITQRIRKMEDVFSIKLLVKEGRGVKLSPEGRTIALKAISALAILEAGNSVDISIVEPGPSRPIESSNNS
jgi:DNA-binding transcriptional LysR family regulator